MPLFINGYFFRSLVFLLFLGITVILYAIPISIFGWIVPFKLTSRVGQHWGKVNLRALSVICGLGYRVHGVENLPLRNCIVLCKHQSAWETIALRALFPPEQTWVIKRELLWTPFFGWAMAAFKPIAIDRTTTRRSVRMLLEEGKYRLDSGRWIMIFPEGTRVAPGEKRNYGQGGSTLAQRTGYPVLPIAHNAGVFWGRREVTKFPGTVDLVIGKPLNPAGLSSAEINRRIEEWIESSVADLPKDR